MGKVIKSKTLIFTFIVVSIAFVGKMDYNDNVEEFNRYCADVTMGVHPDYKRISNQCEK